MLQHSPVPKPHQPLKIGGLGDDSFPFEKACFPIFYGQLLVSHHSISPRTSSWNGAISASHTHTHKCQQIGCQSHCNCFHNGQITSYVSPEQTSCSSL